MNMGCWWLTFMIWFGYLRSIFCARLVSKRFSTRPILVFSVNANCPIFLLQSIPALPFCQDDPHAAWLRPTYWSFLILFVSYSAGALPLQAWEERVHGLPLQDDPEGGARGAYLPEGEIWNGSGVPEGCFHGGRDWQGHVRGPREAEGVCLRSLHTQNIESEDCPTQFEKFVLGGVNVSTSSL